MVQTVIDVAKLQFAENELFGNPEIYCLPVTIGWPPGYKHPELNPLANRLSDHKYLPNREVALENIELNIQRNHEDADFVSPLMIALGIYDPAGNDMTEDEKEQARNLEILYRYAKAGSTFALEQIRNIGIEIVLRECSRCNATHPDAPRDSRFLNFTKPNYRFLDFPEVRAAMQKAAKLALGVDYVVIKLPDDQRSDYFFDVVANTMRWGIARVKRSQKIVYA